VIERRPQRAVWSGTSSLVQERGYSAEEAYWSYTPGPMDDSLNDDDDDDDDDEPCILLSCNVVI
jgi:hypothetical protein